MARIAYSMAGDGGGHSAKNKVIIQALAKKGHKVDVFTSHRTFLELKKTLRSNKNINVFEIPGLAFCFGKKGVSLFKTLLYNIPICVIKPLLHIKLRKLFLKKKYDLLVFDFDFFFASANSRLAKKLGIPRLEVGNITVSQHGKFDVPKNIVKKIKLLKFILDFFHPKADVSLLNSFYKPKKMFHDNSIHTGPILRREVLNSKPSNKGTNMVYMKDSIQGTLYPILLKMKEHKFLVYAFNPSKLEKAEHITLKKIGPSKDFLKNLLSCSCLISSTGNEISSEMIYLEKPMFAIQESGQWEQEINGYFVNKIGLGKSVSSKDLKEKDLRAFLRNKDKFKSKIKKYKQTSFQVGTKQVLKQIDKLLNSYNER